MTKTYMVKFEICQIVDVDDDMPIKEVITKAYEIFDIEDIKPASVIRLDENNNKISRNLI